MGVEASEMLLMPALTVVSERALACFLCSLPFFSRRLYEDTAL